MRTGVSGLEAFSLISSSRLSSRHPSAIPPQRAPEISPEGLKRTLPPVSGSLTSKNLLMTQRSLVSSSSLARKPLRESSRSLVQAYQVRRWEPATARLLK